MRKLLTEEWLNLKTKRCDALGIDNSWTGGFTVAECDEEYTVKIIANNQWHMTYKNQYPKHMMFSNVCSQNIVFTFAEAIRLRAMLPEASTRKMTKAPAFLANFLLQNKTHRD